MKEAHNIWLEPEGLDDHTVYPNGISNTMPEDIQLNFLRMIKGLENVDMLKPGKAFLLFFGGVLIINPI